jgi:NAD(P)-dependent dehydrogenase (short-subunit alcohol dehydrogenase family)
MVFSARMAFSADTRVQVAVVSGASQGIGRAIAMDAGTVMAQRGTQADLASVERQSAVTISTGKILPLFRPGASAPGS